MSGRRWREAVHNAIVSTNIASSPIVVLGGPANSYTHYIATEEEYSIQRYEGASTLYGPHTLNAYINATLSYLPYLSDSSLQPPPPGPSPPDNRDKSISLITGVVYDRTPYFKTFGAVKIDVRPAYTIGDVVSATFVGANPRNSLRLEETYAAIEKLVPEPIRWERVRDDSDWALVFSWKRTSKILGTSEVQIVWETEEWAEAGRYRIRYFGDAKAFGGTVTAFEGMSAEFVLA